MVLDVPTWGVVILVVYPLLQLPVVLYLARYVELGEGESAPGPLDGYAFHGGADGDSRGESGLPSLGRGTTCGRCGAANAVEFRYCRNCVARLA